MQVQVNAEQCNGCGACVEACPSGAIRMHAGLAVIDQAACAQCQACVDACPQGAITSTETSIAAATPVSIQPAREAEIIAAEPAPSTVKPWLAAALAFAGQEILPRLADALIAALDRRLAQTQPANSQSRQPSRNAELVSRQDGRGYRRRIRFGRGQGRGRGLGQGYGNGKTNW